MLKRDAQLVLLLSTLLLPLSSSFAEQKASLSALEQRLDEIDSELQNLAEFSFRGGIGSIGYRSVWQKTQDAKEWIRIDFGQEEIIDQIILVPTIWRDTERGLQADAFPDAFNIYAGTETDETGRLVASVDADARLNPRAAPLSISIPETPAAWIRIETTRLTTRAYDDRYALQLAEVLVFSGEKNAALMKPVTVSSMEGGRGSAWDKSHLVDGSVPYLMDAAHGEKSVAYISHAGEAPVMNIDLLQTYDISGMNLHAVDPGDTVPQAFGSSLGFTPHLQIEGANEPDFSDAVLLYDLVFSVGYEYNPIIMRNSEPAACRYVRIFNADPTRPMKFTRIGFAEIELFSNGRNVALNKPAWGTQPYTDSGRSFSALTDGHNLYGKILPVRTWLNELARRHDLEQERIEVTDQLAVHYQRQKTNLRIMSWLAGILAVGSVITVLIERIFRQRAVFRTRERIAANLHDELGANLHAIGLLGDYAKKIVARKNAQEEWTELTEVIDEVRELTEETGATARYVTNMLEAREIHEDLVGEMQRTADRLLTDLSHDFHIDAGKTLDALKPRKRIDLYLFYKECLINIIRHSGATEAETSLETVDGITELQIVDNGQGLGDKAPGSLKRRARLVGGRLAVDTPPSGGTRIRLTLRPQRGQRLSPKSKSPMSKAADREEPSNHRPPDL